jgi:ABC-type Fe3+-hydroxamate transport system substrate-binding protein
MTEIRRIVSLVPSITETLFDLGQGEKVVGVTRYCAEPVEFVRDLPTVGGPKNPSLDKIAELEPDLVFVNTEENRGAAIDSLRSRFEVHESQPRTISEVTEVLRSMGHRLECWDEAEAYILQIQAQLTRIEVGGLHRDRIRVFYPIWRKPWMSINSDTYIHNVLDVVGAHNVCAEWGNRYPVVDEDRLANLDVELVLLPSEPYEFRLKQQGELLRSGLFPGRQVLLVDGRDFCWHGTRTGAALGRLHEFMMRHRPRVLEDEPK